MPPCDTANADLAGLRKKSSTGIGFALLGAAVAAVAIVRAQYPMLAPLERAALVAQWAAAAALTGALAGVAIGCVAAILPARASPLGIALACLLALSIWPAAITQHSFHNDHGADDVLTQFR